MITLSLKEGFRPLWVLSVDGQPASEIRRSVATRSVMMEAIQKSPQDVLQVLASLSRSYALKLLSSRSYYSETLKKKMKEAGLPLQAIQEAVLFLREKGYLDDQAFVAARVDHWKRSGKSARDIAGRLRTIGVQNVSISNDEKALEVCIQKKYPAWPTLIQEKKTRDKLIASLVRRGFSLSLIISFFAKKSIHMACLEESEVSI